MDHRMCEILETYGCAIVYTRFQGFIVPRIFNNTHVGIYLHVYQKFRSFKDRDRVEILNSYCFRDTTIRGTDDL